MAVRRRSPDDVPTSTQRNALRWAAHPGIERRRYRLERPDSLEFRWYWMVVGTEQKVSDGTVQACESRGWVVIEREKLPDWEEIEAICNNVPARSWVRLTLLGREVLNPRA